MAYCNKPLKFYCLRFFVSLITATRAINFFSRERGTKWNSIPNRAASSRPRKKCFIYNYIKLYIQLYIIIDMLYIYSYI